MSRRNGILDFSGGMNNVKPPHLLGDSEAEQITNLYLDKDGLWKDINNPSVMLDLSSSHLATAIKVIQWKPTKVPTDCVDDFVYVVFCSDGVVKLVYRGIGELQVISIDIKARLHDTNTYYSVAVTAVTPDMNGKSSGVTSESPFESITRVYLEGTDITMTVPIEAVSGKEFLHWMDDITGVVIGGSNQLEITVSNHIIAIAEYVTVPYISVADETGKQITDLGEFEAEIGKYSQTKEYYVSGINVAAPIRIYPPEEFEISLDGSTWVLSPSYIEISALDATDKAKKIYVRYFGTEE